MASKIQKSLKDDSVDTKKIEESIFKFLLYKVKNVTIIPFVKRVNPSTWTAKEARELEIKLRKWIMMVYAVEVLFTMIDFFLSVESRSNIKDFSNMIITDFDYPLLDVIQFILAFIAAYLLIIYSSLQEKVACRDDPFRTASILAIILLVVTVQKYFIESFLRNMFSDQNYFNQHLLVTFRQSFVAIEILFI